MFCAQHLSVTAIVSWATHLSSSFIAAKEKQEQDNIPKTQFPQGACVILQPNWQAIYRSKLWNLTEENGGEVVVQCKDPRENVIFTEY